MYVFILLAILSAAPDGPMPILEVTPCYAKLTPPAAPIGLPAAKKKTIAFVWSATWCGPCRVMRPIIESLRAEGWQIVDKDADADSEEVAECEIVAVPTVQLGRGGVEIARRSGLQTADSLRAWFRFHKVKQDAAKAAG